jgi:[protein-PII] uridylyltransferase
MTMRPLFQREAPVTRETYREGMARTRLNHRAGDSGLHTARQLSKLGDTCLLSSFDQVLARNPALSERLAVVPVGGYGRQQLNPYSDLDILILHHSDHNQDEEEGMKQFFQQLWDMGLKLGHSTRTPEDCIEVIAEDHITTTALLENRFLCGSQSLYDWFRGMFFGALQGDMLRKLLDDKLAELEDRNSRYGRAINVVEPNLKVSPGGIRDYHFAVWVALAKYNTNGLQGLAEEGVICPSKLSQYQRSLDYILRLRHELHFTAGRLQDHLSYDWQERVAKELGYRDADPVLAEEIMMRNYYKAADQLNSLVQIVANNCREKSRNPVQVACHDTRTPEDTYLVGKEVRVADRVWLVSENPSLLFDFFEFMHDNPDLILSSLSEYRVGEAMDTLDSSSSLQSKLGRRFMKMLSTESGAGRSLRIMQEVGFLERFLPEWLRVRNLIRKDLYHHYSVNEHLIRAVEMLENIPADKSREERKLAALWSDIDRRDLLRLATLLHDVGKGHGTDHSAGGEKIAEKFCHGIGLSRSDSDLVRRLVAEHLIMTRFIHGSDPGSREALLEFAHKVRTPRFLTYLYLLTYADVMAVAAGAMSVWKLSQLSQLYLGTMKILEQGLDRISSSSEARGNSIDRLWEALCGKVDQMALQRHLSNVPENYVIYTPPTLVQRHLEALAECEPERAAVRFHGDGATRPLEIILATQDRVGLFYLLCCACFSVNLSIHYARLDRLADGTILDTLNCFSNPPGVKVEGQLLDLLREKIHKFLSRSTLPKVQRPAPILTAEGKDLRSKFRCGVKLHNPLSRKYTVLEIRTLDRIGVIRAIAGTLVKHRCNILFARINTEGMRVVDVFYITDREGNPLEDETRMQELQQALEDILG